MIGCSGHLLHLYVNNTGTGRAASQMEAYKPVGGPPIVANQIMSYIFYPALEI